MEVTTFDNFLKGLDARYKDSKGGLQVENGRLRFNVVQPIQAPKKETGLPSGKRQGIYAFGDWIVVIIAGGFWYLKDGIWRHAGSVAMDPLVDTVYVEQVPLSTNNFPRQELFPGSSYQKTPSGLIVCDGINQPFIVFADGQSLRLRNYQQWKKSRREYVPIGIMPRMIGNILYMVAKDSNGRYTQILRSVSGRPLDFVVNVTADANKNGDAFTTAHSVGYDEIRSIVPTAQADTFLVFVSRSCEAVQVNHSFMLFGEPTFRNHTLFPVGILDYFSIGDSMGDLIFADKWGLNSFNVIVQEQERSNNQPFFQQIAALLPHELEQVRITSHDNYLMVAIKGTGVLVFDKVLGVWVSLDKIEVDGFARSNDDRLYFYNDTGVYEYYGNNYNLTCRLRFGRMFFGSTGSPSGFALAHEGIERMGHRLRLNDVYGEPRQLTTTDPFGSLRHVESKAPICDAFSYELSWKNGELLGVSFVYELRTGEIARSHRADSPAFYTVPGTLGRTRFGEVEFFVGEAPQGDALYKVRVPEDFEPGEEIYVGGFAMWSATKYIEV